MPQNRQQVTTIIVDHGAFVFRQIRAPVPRPDEALIRVAAVSLERDDVERALAPGSGRGVREWDFAGTVELAAADGSGPGAGMRVAGLARSGGWAELAAVPSSAVAEISEAVTFAQAATLPISGLTALRGLGWGGLLAAQRVLVTLATCGVGLLAVQLAHASSADVTALIRNPEHEALMEEYGADRVLMENPAAAAGSGPFDYILDIVGGLPAEVVSSVLDEGGVYVFNRTPGGYARAGLGHAVLSGYKLRRIRSLARGLPSAVELGRLFALVRAHTLEPHVDIEEAWTDIAAVARVLGSDDRVGRAVLHVSPC